MPPPPAAPASLPLLAALLAAPLAAASGAAYGASSLLVLRVGDGSARPLANASLPPWAAPAFLLEINSVAGTLVGAAHAVPGLTITGNDYTAGTLTRSPDGAFAAFGGLGAPVGTPASAGLTCTVAGSCFAGYSRVLARVAFDGSVDTSTVLPHSTLGGLIKGTCLTAGGQGFYIAVNDTAVGIGYVPFGSSGPITDAHGAVGGSRSFVACQVSATSKKLYVLRSTSVPLADTAPIPADPATSLTLAASLTANSISATPYYGKQIIMNAAETLFWVAIVSGVVAGDGGIYRGASLTTMTIAVPSTYRVTGIALSADESTVFFTSRGAPGAVAHAVWSVPASCTTAATCLPTRIYSADPNTELRGIVIAPQPPVANASAPSPTSFPTPAASPSPSPAVNASKPCAAGTAKNGGATCVTCAAGTFAAAGAASCSPCAAATYSLAGAATCAACPTGPKAFPSANTLTGQATCGCLAGNYFSGVAPPSCIACPAGSANTVNGSAVCTCAAAHAVFVATAPAACVCDIATGYSSLGLSGAPGQPALSCAPCSSGACAAGTYQTGACSATSGVTCSVCSSCGDGYIVQTPCSAMTNTVCAKCPPGQYSYGVSGENAATCVACGAGSAPSASGGGCTCADPNAVWTDISNSCSCLPNYTPTGAGGLCVACTTCSSQTPSNSVTPSVTPTGTRSPSISPTGSLSQGASSSLSASSSLTSSISVTPSVTPSKGSSLSSTPTASRSASPSAAASTGASVSSAPAASTTTTPSATPSKSFGASDAPLMGSGAAGTAASSGMTTGTAVGVVLGILAAVAAAAYFALTSRKDAKRRQPNAAPQQWQARADSAAPVVVASTNPLQADAWGSRAAGGAGTSAAAGAGGRVAFAPQAAAGGAGAEAATEWIECFDSAQGITYFASKATGEAVWKIPDGGVIVSKMSK